MIEGFYGPAWSPVDRLWLLERMGSWGMNCYVYAPKDDPLHRERWREPYPESERSAFRELVRGGERWGVQVGFALSPGLSIEYSSAKDRARLAEKLRSFAELGSRLLVLALDDVPDRLVHAEDQRAFASLASAHAELVCELRAALDPALALWVVPTEYLGTEPTPYLEHLGRALPAEVEVGWTGRTVLSPTIERGEARRRAQTLQRRLWLWDNLPVSDGPMRHMLHLAPYLGRDPELDASVSCVLLNPMQRARASAPTLHTAAAYLRDPRGYDPEGAWEAALAELGGALAPQLRLFALAHRASPQSLDARDAELETRFAALRAALEAGADVPPALAALRVATQERAAVAADLREGLGDRRLVAELEPWLESHRVETERIAIAVDALDPLLGEAERGVRAVAFMRMEARLTQLPAVRAASYGPRRVLYPQLSSMRMDAMGFGSDPTLVRARALSDEIVDFAADVALRQLGPASPGETSVPASRGGAA